MKDRTAVMAEISRIVIERHDANGRYLGTIEVSADGTVKNIVAGGMTDGELVMGNIHADD